MKKEELQRDTLVLAETIINFRCSLETCAEFWGIPKSTLQYRLSTILPKISQPHYTRVKQILNEHNTILISQQKHPERWNINDNI